MSYRTSKGPVARLRTDRHDGIRDQLFMWLRSHGVTAEREVPLRVLEGAESQRPRVMDLVHACVVKGEITWIEVNGVTEQKR